MIDDCQLAEAISVLFTVLSTFSVAFGLLHMSHRRMADGIGEHLSEYLTVVKTNRSFPSCISMKGFHLLSSIQHHDVKQVNRQK